MLSHYPGIASTLRLCCILAKKVNSFIVGQDRATQDANSSLCQAESAAASSLRARERVIVICLAMHRATRRLIPCIPMIYGIITLLANSDQVEKPVRIQILARGLSLKPLSLTGHIFMLVTVNTTSGPASEAYGFYPRNGGRGMIKGPGLLKSEYRCSGLDDCKASQDTIAKLARDSDSVTFRISLRELRTVMHDVNQWNSANFDLTQHNCIDFVRTIVNDLGFETPPRSQLQYPRTYFNRLKELTAQNDAKEAERNAAKEAALKAKRDSSVSDGPQYPEVSGSWIDNHGTAFSVSQDRGALVFSGPPPFGRGKGSFVSGDTFNMRWPALGAYGGKVAADARSIQWTNGVRWSKR